MGSGIVKAGGQETTGRNLAANPPESASGVAPEPMLPAVGSQLVQRKIARRLQDRATGVGPGADNAVAAAAGAAGQALPGEVAKRFGSSLGTDLSGVRVHTGGPSAAAAQTLNARAYTVGNDIHFGAGQYDPGSASGQHLLAHEVAHTVQQRGAAAAPMAKLEVSTPGDAQEVEADQAADAMVDGRGASVGVAGGLARAVIQRYEAGEQGGARRGTGWQQGSGAAAQRLRRSFPHRRFLRRTHVQQARPHGAVQVAIQTDQGR